MFCFALLNTLNPQKAYACCERAHAPILGDWTDYEEENCPNSYGYQCSLRRCIGRVKPRCNLGVLCGPTTGFSCLPNCSNERVVYCADTCNDEDDISIEWQWYQIEPDTSCDPYICFCRCTGTHAMKELDDADCYND